MIGGSHDNLRQNQVRMIILMINDYIYIVVLYSHYPLVN